LKFADVIELSAKCTVARMLERDDFAKRYQREDPISVHEFFYPLMQGYDSIAIKADVELGGTDQKFNLLMGRTLQREYGQEPQVALMTPILEGLDGSQKMSKSLNNYIGITDSPNEMYGKTMSIADELIVRYFELVTTYSPDEVAAVKHDLNLGMMHPRDAKMKLAREIVSLYHNSEEAHKAEEQFKQVFSRGELPDEIPEFSLSGSGLDAGKVWLPKLMHAADMTPSTSEARRLIKQGAVKIDGMKVEDPDAEITLTDGMVIKAGKRKFLKIRS